MTLLPMPRRKPFSKMPGDLRKVIIKGRKETAKTIVRSLTEKVRGGQEHLEKTG